MADLLSHPWMTGDTATDAEFCASYNEIMKATIQRVTQENVDTEFNIDEAEKQSQVRGNGQRNSGDKFPKDFEQDRKFKAAPKFESGERNTVFDVSGEESHPLAIMHYLYDLVSSIGENINISDSSWKLKFDGITR